MKRIMVLLFLLLSIVLVVHAVVVKYKVNPHKCITCGLCVQTKVCPTNAISMHKGKAVIDQSKCIGCTLCETGNRKDYKGCPTGAFEKITLASTPKVTTTEVHQVVEKKDAEPVAETKQVTPTAGKAMKTGTVKPKLLTYLVNPEMCIGCQLCVTNCPTHAIDFIDGKAVINQSKCNHCGTCKNGNNNDFAGCPVGAISSK